MSYYNIPCFSRRAPSRSPHQQHFDSLQSRYIKMSSESFIATLFSTIGNIVMVIAIAYAIVHTVDAITNPEDGESMLPRRELPQMGRFTSCSAARNCIQEHLNKDLRYSGARRR